MMHSKIALDDLPKYSRWPALTLGLADFQAKAKTPAEVTREYDLEKWQEVSDWIDSNPSLLYTDVDTMRFAKADPLPCFKDGEFQLLPPIEAHAQHVALCAEAMAGFTTTATALLELGAGYGSTLFGIHQRIGFSDLPLYAAEFSPVGVRTIRELARNSGQIVSAGRCDFYTSTMDNLKIPPDSIVFTSYAACYVPQLTPDFIQMISDLRPAAVFHFEPCFEHYSTQTIHGLMCRRYVQMNDYNQNLVSLLHSQQALGMIDIFDEHPVVMGGNPLLPISVLGWKPKLSSNF